MSIFSTKKPAQFSLIFLALSLSISCSFSSEVGQEIILGRSWLLQDGSLGGSDGGDVLNLFCQVLIRMGLRMDLTI